MADCTKTSWPGLTALIDLVDPSDYEGFSGRLYESNSNNPPAGHNTQALAAANAVVRLDSSGVFSPTGKKVFISCGMSNTDDEFNAFMDIAEPASDVVIVNCAIASRDALQWADPESDVWDTVETRLAGRGVNRQQVEVIWAKHAIAGVTGTFPTWAEGLQQNLKDFVLNAKAFFPQLRQIFFSSRTYGGYNDTAANPEEYAYESGFSVKWLIETQTAATDPDVSYANLGVTLLWGPYLWANGTTANSEGTSYACADFESDGLHPDTGAETTVANLLNEFFTTSPYTAWYRSANTITALSSLSGASAGVDDDEYTLPSFTLAPYQMAVVGVFSRHGSATPVEPTLAGHGLTWSQIVTRPFHTEGTPRGRLTAFYAINGDTESTDTVVATFGGPQTQVVCQMQAVGVGGISLLGDAVAQSNSNSLDTQTSLEVELLNAPAAESSVVAFFALATLSNNIVPQAGCDERYDLSSSSPTTKMATHTNDLFVDTVTVTWGANTSNAAGLLIEIKAATVQQLEQAVAGSLDSVGVIGRLPLISLLGSVASSGAAARLPLVSLLGGVVSAGTAVKQAVVGKAGVLGSAGGAVWLPLKGLAGVVGPDGAAARLVSRALGGAVAPAGAVAGVVQIVINLTAKARSFVLWARRRLF